MSDGRTIWRTKDCLWHEREWIVILVDEFGPAGYAVIDYLEGQAKLQNDGGQVKTGPRAIARATGTDPVTVCHVLSRSVTLGLLLDYRESNGRFICTIAWFGADQGKGMAASRQAKRRASDPVDKGDPPSLSRSVTPRHGPSRPVTNTVQDSTASPTEKNSTAELRSAGIRAFDYWRVQCDHPHAQFGPDRERLAVARLRERKRHHGGSLAAAVADLHTAIDGAARAPFVDERGKRHDSFELICRSNSKLEDFIGRASLPEATATVHPIRPVRETASDWLNEDFIDGVPIVDAEIIDDTSKGDAA